MTSIETAAPPAQEEHTVPPLAQRIRGVLLEPVATFRALEPSWGLVGPWLVVMAAGLVYAVVAIAQVDYAALTLQRTAYAQTFASDQERRAMAQAEQSVDLGKWGSFAARLFLLAGPPLGTILGVVFMGLVLFGAAATFGGKKDLLRAIVVAAHAKLVALVYYAAVFVGMVMRNPSPQTSVANVADEVAQPVLWAALGLIDPVALWHTMLLGVGLSVSLGVKPRRAAVVVAAIHAAGWLVWLGFAALSLAQRR